jgi:hypothetical protein
MGTGYSQNNLGATVKKKEAEIKQVKGWEATNDIATKCGGCNRWMNFGEAVYHQKVDGHEMIRCRGCADKP